MMSEFSPFIETNDTLIKHLVKENKELKNKIVKMENLILHLRNKFLNIMDNVNISGFRMIEHVIEFIDENIKQKKPTNKSDKFNNHLKSKMSKE